MSGQQPQSSPQVPHQAPPQQQMQQTQPPAQQQVPQHFPNQALPQQVQQPQQHLRTPNPTPPPQQQQAYHLPPQVQQQSTLQQAPQILQQQGQAISGPLSQQPAQITHQSPQPGTPQIQQPQQPQQQQQPARPQVQTQYTGPPQQQPYPQQMAGQTRPYQAPSQSPGATAYYTSSQPPLKRQRVSPDPRSAPTSPYTQSPYGPSPTTTQAAPFPNALPQQPYQGPYSNPNPAPLSHPSPYSAPPPQPSTYQAVQPNNLHQQPPHLQPQPGYAPPANQYQNSYIPPPQQQPLPHQMTPNTTMGPPPFRPAAKEESANDDQMDVLANAGVDLRAEESFAMSFYTAGYNSQPQFGKSGPNTTGAGFNQFSPGDAASFYGAGPANQPGISTNGKTQEQIEEETAKAAWMAATNRLAQSRQHELQHPHTHVGALWNRMAKIAQENGLVLSTDKGQMPQLKLPHEFPSILELKTKAGPGGSLLVADGTFLPQDTALADQLALMSLATNTRIRILLEETVALARSRRVGSHGVIPDEYKDIAVTQSPAAGTIVPENGPRHGFESSVSPRASPLNGSAPQPLQPTNGNKPGPEGQVQMSNDLIKVLREAAARERQCEEARLQRRADRLANPGATPAAPGTPMAKGGAGDIAPEPSSKPLTKKEREKQDKGKQSLVDSHAQANATTATFLFGGKKKNKYSWMDASGGSGASTPGRVGTGAGITGLGGTPEKVRLTQDGKNRMGGFREDRDGGKGVQLRDLILALEHDGREQKALQTLYPWLDTPKPKPGPAFSGGPRPQSLSMLQPMPVSIYPPAPQPMPLPLAPPVTATQPLPTPDPTPTPQPARMVGM